MRFITILLIIISLNYQITFADTIFFKSGMRLDVERTWEENGQIKCKMYGSTVSYSKDEVEKVVVGKLPDEIESNKEQKKSKGINNFNDKKGVKNVPTRAYSSKKWYQGGNLHKKTVMDWKNATSANKLATSADMATASKKVKAYINQQGSVEAVKPFAIQLMTCIDEAAAGKGYESMKVAELAAACMILMKW